MSTSAVWPPWPPCALFARARLLHHRLIRPSSRDTNTIVGTNNSMEMLKGSVLRYLSLDKGWSCRYSVDARTTSSSMAMIQASLIDKQLGVSRVLIVCDIGPGFFSSPWLKYRSRRNSTKSDAQPISSLKGKKGCETLTNSPCDCVKQLFRIRVVGSLSPCSMGATDGKRV
jgi:hypothetical protein